jgi:gamma-glutamylcyclotransferase (GGCT)/AIG2-like uncharacterized protein YtfP
VSEQVFVYGTLRVGDIRHGVETFVKVIASEAYIKGYRMLNLGGFPGLVPLDIDFEDQELLESCPQIRGEVHEYEHLEVLDGIEGYSEDHPEKGFYNREEVTADMPDGQIRCWVYIFNIDKKVFRVGPPVIQSGDWFNREEEPVMDENIS